MNPTSSIPGRHVDGDTRAILRERGLRVTTARLAVLDRLRTAGTDHLTADELAADVRRRHPTVHLSTVYRTLDTLSDAGLISLARFGDQPATYHLTDDVHHHAVCTSCGATLVVPPAMFESVRRRLLAEHGFRADPHHLTIEGRCADCVSR